MLWAKQQGKRQFRAYHHRIFVRFWRRELEIEDPASIAIVLSEVGADATGFADFWRAKAAVNTMQSASLQKPLVYLACPASLLPASSAAQVLADGRLVDARPCYKTIGEPRIKSLMCGRRDAHKGISCTDARCERFTADKALEAIAEKASIAPVYLLQAPDCGSHVPKGFCGNTRWG
jgi:hypothetical protein